MRPDAGDDALVAAARSGSEDAFAHIVRRHERALRSYAARLLRGTGHDPADVVQDVFIRAHAALTSGDQRELALRAWLYRLTRNRAIDMLRSPPAPVSLSADDAPPVPDRADDPVTLIARRARVAAIVRDLAQLPVPQREALLLRELEGLSHADVARELEVSEAASRKLVGRARENLSRAQAARDASCVDVREGLLAAHDARTRPSEHARRHLAGCDACSGFQRELKRTRRAVAALSPGPAILAAVGLGKAALGGGAKAAAVVTGSVVAASAGAGAIVLATSVIGSGQPAPRLVPGSARVLGQRIARGTRLPADYVQVEQTVRLAPVQRLTHAVFTLRCPGGAVAVAPVPDTTGRVDPALRGDSIVNSGDLGRATFIRWRIFWKATRPPHHIDRHLGLLCRKRR